MKQKTHSGAKKRFKPKAGGKIKRKQKGLRHILENKSSSRKRSLRPKMHIHDADMNNVKKMLCL